MSITIAVDAVGGDFGPPVIFPAVKQFLIESPQIRVILFISPGARSTLSQYHLDTHPRCSWVEANTAIAPSDTIADVLKRRPSSAAALAMKSVCAGQAQAVVSAEHTGPLMVLGRRYLGVKPGIRRPAICKPIPTLGEPCYLLDVGANLEASPDMLHQFAQLGAALVRASEGILAPKVGLLNVGVEREKGSATIKETADKLERDTSLRYAGFVEGDQLFLGGVNVVVCDGFVGNVALKVTEGVARLSIRNIRQAFGGGWYARLLGQLARPLLRKWHKQFDPARYNGACFLGLNHVLVKSHGGADQPSFLAALHMAEDVVQRQILDLQ